MSHYCRNSPESDENGPKMPCLGERVGRHPKEGEVAFLPELQGGLRADTEKQKGGGS